MATRDDWMRRLGPLYGGAIALVRSTLWRWPAALADEPPAPGWLVAVGAPLGALAGAVGAVTLALGAPAPVAAVFAVASLTLASAALAERGLAERADRWTGHAGPDLGVGATLALAFATLLRVVAIASIRPDRWLGVMVVAPVVGRWCVVWLQALGEPLPDDHAPRSLVSPAPPIWLVAATGAATTAVAIAMIGVRAGLGAVGVGAGLVFVLGVDAEHRDGALSPTVVGAASAVGELAVLVAATLG